MLYIPGPSNWWFWGTPLTSKGLVLEFHRHLFEGPGIHINIYVVIYIYTHYMPSTHLTFVLIGKDYVLASKQGSIRF